MRSVTLSKRAAVCLTVVSVCLCVCVSVLMSLQVKIDGITYQLRVGTDRVYESGDECRFVGMLRSDGTIEYGVDDDDIIPPGVKPNMMPGYHDSSLDPRSQDLGHKSS
jgi:hypothetical protein